MGDRPYLAANSIVAALGIWHSICEEPAASARLKKDATDQLRDVFADALRPPPEPVQPDKEVMPPGPPREPSRRNIAQPGPSEPVGRADIWREAVEAAAKIADNLGDNDKNDNLINDDMRWVYGYEIACREIAAAIRSLKPNPEGVVRIAADDALAADPEADARLKRDMSSPEGET